MQVLPVITNNVMEEGHVQSTVDGVLGLIMTTVEPQDVDKAIRLGLGVARNPDLPMEEDLALDSSMNEFHVEMTKTVQEMAHGVSGLSGTSVLPPARRMHHFKQGKEFAHVQSPKMADPNARVKVSRSKNVKTYQFAIWKIFLKR